MSEFEDFVKAELPQRSIVQVNEPLESLLIRRGPIPKAYVSVELAEGEVLGKLNGIIKGILVTGTGGSDKNYVHDQLVVSTTWTVLHNLSKYPSVTVIDSGGTEVEGDIIHTNTAQTVLQFSAPFAGRAIFN